MHEEDEKRFLVMVIKVRLLFLFPLVVTKFATFYGLDYDKFHP